MPDTMSGSTRAHLSASQERGLRLAKRRAYEAARQAARRMPHPEVEELHGLDGQVTGYMVRRRGIPALFRTREEALAQAGRDAIGRANVKGGEHMEDPTDYLTVDELAEGLDPELEKHAQDAFAQRLRDAIAAKEGAE